MTLAEISIRKPVFAWMLMAALILFGGLNFQRMGVSQLPDVDYPTVNVSVRLEGASPQVMEVDVARPLEEAVLSVQGITGLSSSARYGSASVTAEFDVSTDINFAVQEIESAVSGAMRRLPRDSDPPTVSKSSPDDHPILWLAVSATDWPSAKLMQYVQGNLKDRFTAIPGVAEIFLGGYVDPSLRVWVSNDALNRYSLTVADVVNAIKSEHIEVPAGRLETREIEFALRTLGEAPTREEFEKLSIIRRGGGPNFLPITLGDIASVEEGLGDVRRKSRSQGVPAVGIGIRKQRGANSVAVAKAVKGVMAQLQKELPSGLDIGIRNDSTVFIERAVRELEFTLLLSGILTALVCWIFLGSWSSTFNVVLAIPTSVIGSFIVLNALGFTLNLFTLLALSLAIGIVVDDAIMVLENIVRHREMKKGRSQAALDGAIEITFAALAATLAIVAIFLPVAFMKGIIGKYFFQFGITLSVAVMVSLLEALTLTPMRCAQFLDVKPRSSRLGMWVESSFEGLARAYGRVIPWVLGHRWKVVAGAVALSVAGFALVWVIPREFVPPEDQGMLMVRIQAPLGSPLDYTDKRLLEIEKYLTARPEVSQYFSGVGGFGGGDVNTGMVFVTLKDVGDRGPRPKSQQELVPIFREGLKEVKGARITVSDPSIGGFTSRRGFPVEFTVRGPDWDTLVTSSEALMKAMSESGEMVEVDSDYQAGQPELVVTPDRNLATRYGVSVSDIGTTVNALIGGTLVGRYSKDGHRYDVRLRLKEEFRRQKEDIRKIKVLNNRGELISLASVVKVSEQKSLQRISRIDRERAISIYANLVTGVSQASAIETVHRMAKEKLPTGYRAVVAGSSKGFGEAFSSLIFALVLGVIVAYMILASQFNSFIHPVTVLTALPFSLVGAFIALYLTGKSLNIYSLIGIVLLMGIVKKNSILLVAFTIQLRESGASVSDAISRACPIRLRPILMTSISTVAGAIPAALAIGPGAESRIPMAIAVIGGVIVSTVLTLFVVPCVYSLLAGWERQQEVRG